MALAFAQNERPRTALAAPLVSRGTGGRAPELRDECNATVAIARTCPAAGPAESPKQDRHAPAAATRKSPPSTTLSCRSRICSDRKPLAPRSPREGVGRAHAAIARAGPEASVPTGRILGRSCRHGAKLCQGYARWRQSGNIDARIRRLSSGFRCAHGSRCSMQPRRRWDRSCFSAYGAIGELIRPGGARRARRFQSAGLGRGGRRWESHRIRGGQASPRAGSWARST